MGYGLPAAIGVQIAHPKKLVIDIAGEASILMNIQEMSTAIQYRLPVKIFILNNEYMGMVRQWQELFLMLCGRGEKRIRLEICQMVRSRVAWLTLSLTRIIRKSTL